jgi:chromosome segregation ATPase
MVENGMGNDGTGRRSPWDLFAERQVHMRSGRESRYIVLSRSLQIGVAVGFLAILALLAIASYTAIARHVALVVQEQTVEEVTARAAQADQSTRNELATLRQRNEAAEDEIEQLTAALAQAQAERTAAVTASTEAGAKAAELEAALATTMRESRKFSTDLEAMRGSGEVRSPRRSTETQALLAEITGLRAELERVDRETEALRRTAAQARQALRDLQSGATQATPVQARPDEPRAAPPLRLAIAAAPATDEVRQLQQDLAGAQSTVAALSADLEAAKGAAAGAGTATDAAADLATLKEQLGAAHRRAEQLGVTLAAEQSEEAAGDAPPDAAPLPSPPAPR